MKRTLTLSALLVLSVTLSAQPARYLINSGFELPVLGCSPASYSILPESEIPGWVSSDAVARARISCAVAGATMTNGMELWQTNFNSIPSHSGNQFAEVNAYVNSGMYETLCLLPNETVTFSIWHRKRTNDTNRENLIVQLIDPASGTVVGTASTTHDATFGSWTLYSGTVVNNGVQGARRLGIFGRHYNPDGSLHSNQSVGNLIDDADIDLKPLVDIKRFSPVAITEGSSTNGSTDLEIYVSGNIKTGTPATVTIQKSGTAVYNTDYTIGTPTRGSVTVNANGDITLTLPAGDYDPSTSAGANAGIIVIPFTAVADGPDNNETVTYTITASTGGGGGNTSLDLAYNIGGYSAGCAVRTGTASFSIFDSPIVLSGQLYNDADGLKDGLVNGIGTNAGGTMYITVVNSAGNVVASKALPATGIYSFTSTEVPNGTYSLRIGTTLGVAGNPAPAAALPSSNWVFTGEGLTAGGDGTVNGIITGVVINSTTTVEQADFGIERLPLTDNITAATQVNPGGTTQVVVPALKGSDAEDLPAAGSDLTGKDLVINTLPTASMGILYYDGVPVTAGQVIQAYTPALLTFDPVNSAVTATFTYSYRDESLRTSTNPATVTMPFTTPLPVTLLSLAAVSAGEDVLVVWQTSSETNNSHFDIEYSTDGITFIKAGTVPAATGNTSIVQHYSFTHRQAIRTQRAPVLYYRLKQVDIDGRFTYTNVVSVKIKGDDKTVLSVYPNPVQGNKKVWVVSERIRSIVVYASNGQKVSQQQYAGQSLAELSVEHLLPGVYFMVVNGELSKKIVVNK